MLIHQDAQAAAAKLEALNKTTNQGRGSSVCRSVVLELRANDVPGAIMIAELDYDKVRQYPKMAALFKEIGLIKPNEI